MLKRLKDTGYIDVAKLEGKEIPSVLKKSALLVYQGTFMSMDGEVDVTEDHLTSLEDKYNTQLSKLKRMAGGSVPVRSQPPIMLDHSTSSHDVVGRVSGKLTTKRFKLDDGSEVLGLFTDELSILGKENVEKVVDGRWTHLSVGADFEKSNLSELTITPFPAAEQAALLKRGQDMNEETKKRLVAYLQKKNKLSAEGAESLLNGAENSFLKRLQEQEKEEKEKEEKKLQEEKDKEEKKLQEEKDEKEKKLTSFLQEKDELESEDEAKEKMAGMTDDEKASLQGEYDEKEKKLSNAQDAPNTADGDPGKQEDLKTEKGMESLKRMTSDFRSNIGTAKLAIAKVKIRTRLARLRADAKISPAEIKKIDIERLAKENPATRDAVLKSYEDREPVIAVGVLGTQKAENIADVQHKIELQELEQETRSRFKSNPKNKDVRLSSMSNAQDAPDSVSLAGDYDKDYEKMCSLIDGDSKDEAKNHLKALLSQFRSGSYKGLQSSTEEDEKHMSALAESFEVLENRFEGIVKLVGKN